MNKFIDIPIDHGDGIWGSGLANYAEKSVKSSSTGTVWALHSGLSSLGMTSVVSVYFYFYGKASSGGVVKLRYRSKIGNIDYYPSNGSSSTDWKTTSFTLPSSYPSSPQSIDMGAFNVAYLLNYGDIGMGLAPTSGNYKTTLKGCFVRITYTVPDEYLAFDSIINFKKWKDAGITSGNKVSISNLTDSSVKVTSTDSTNNDGFTGESPLFPVSAGNSYTFNADIAGSGWEVFVFFHKGTASWSSFSNFTSVPHTFTVPSGIDNISIRFDANANGNSVTFANIRIYPADCEYMSVTASETERYLRSSDAFKLPAPTRAGFAFKGWYTELAAGSKVTSFPSGGGVVYSHWTKKPPEFKSIIITGLETDESVKAGNTLILTTKII